MDDSKSISKKASSTKGLDIIIIGVIALVFFLCPLFFTGLAAQGLGFEKMLLFYFLVLIGTVAWVTKGVIQGEMSVKRTPLDLPILATIAAFVVSTILSISTKDSIVGSYGNSAKSLVAVIVFSLFYYLVVNNLNAKRIKIIFWSLISSTFFLVVYSLLQLKGIHVLPFDFSKNIGFNPLGSLSALTMYLVAVFPMLVVASAQAGTMFEDSKKSIAIVVKVMSGITALGSLMILALLNGFTFWPIAVVGMVIVLMFFLAKIIKITSNNLVIPLAGFLFLIILLVIGNFSIIDDMKLPAEVSLSRGASWDIAKDGIKENPIFGSGPSTFYYSFSKYKSQNFNASPLWNVRFDSASGAVFEFMSTVGVFGLLSIIVLGLIALSISFLALIKIKDKGISSMMLGFFASFISLALFALLFSQNNSMILLTVLVSVLTVSSALVMYPDKFKDLKLSFRASPKYALSLAAIFLCVSAGVVVLFTMGLKMYMADTYAKNSLLTSDVAKKVELLNKAITLAPYQDSYYLSLANNYMALANQAAISSKDQAVIGDFLAKAIESGKKAVDINGNKASNNESLALVYENASFYTRGALEWAEQLYEKVSELDPKNPTPALRIALVNMARANAETDEEEKRYYISEAVKKYDEAISRKNDLAAAYYGKAIAHEKLGDNSNAIEQLKKANLVSRNNLDYRFELGRLYFNRGIAQAGLRQTASDQIAKNDINPDSSTSTERLSVQPTVNSDVVVKSDDLKAAEQLFLSILTVNANHANAKYSLAVLYQKVGELENAKMIVNSLLDTVKDQKTKQAVMAQFEDIIN